MTALFATIAIIVFQKSQKRSGLTDKSRSSGVEDSMVA